MSREAAPEEERRDGDCGGRIERPAPLLLRSLVWLQHDGDPRRPSATRRRRRRAGGELHGTLSLVGDGRPGPTGTYVRDGVRDLGGCRGAEPSALGPRSGNSCRFETLEGHFLVKIEMLAP